MVYSFYFAAIRSAGLQLDPGARPERRDHADSRPWASVHQTHPRPETFGLLDSVELDQHNLSVVPSAVEAQVPAP